MGILAWAILGIVAGFIASKVVHDSGQGLIINLVLGVVGALVGGWIMSFFGKSGVSGLNLYSLVVAVGGAIVVLILFQAIKHAA